VAIGSRLIIRRLWPLKPTDKILFLFYFSRHKLEISHNNAQAKKFMDQGASALYHGAWILKKFCKDNGSLLFAS
tara:strand:- start:65 stop:286 length:222 start_codon:yes stop_codon:yes gene_type:complete